MKCRIRELISEQTETWNDRCPSPSRGFEGIESDLEQVAGLSTVDLDRARDRIDLAKIHSRDIADIRVDRQLSTGRIDGVDFDRIAGRDRHHRHQGVVPAKVVMRRVDGV